MINIKTDNFIKISSKAVEAYYDRAKSSWDSILNSFKDKANNFALKAKSNGQIKEAEKLNAYHEKTRITNAPILIGGMSYKGWECIIDQAKENKRADILNKIEEFFKTFKYNSEQLSDHIYNTNKQISIADFLSSWKEPGSNPMCGENGIDKDLKDMIIDLGTDSGTVKSVP